ncbi:MAG: GNAT family N-acetyltransferase, partial [Myxococcaceae bacterium]
PTGSVVGVDPAASMLEMAARRSTAEGLRNLELRTADAALLNDLAEQSFDAVLCRWGVTYMQEPVAAMRRARAALKQTGKAVFAVWAEPERTEWFSLSRFVLNKYQPTTLHAPGTFLYADLETMRRDLGQAGFQIAQVEELHVPIVEATEASELVTYARALGLDALLDPLPASTQESWQRDFIRELETRRRGGVIQLGGITCIVTCSTNAKSVGLRAYVESDFPCLFEHQRDREAIRTGAIPSRNWEEFAQHLATILVDPTVIHRVITLNGETVGSIGSFQKEGQAFIGYSLDRRYWGQGIGTEALRQHLPLVKERPLFAKVSKGNVGSRRVLEKNGFVVISEQEGAPDAQGKPVTDLLLRLGQY